MHRPRMELSKNSIYYVEKYRRYELMYFCMQYDYWKRELVSINYYPTVNYSKIKTNEDIQDKTSEIAIRIAELELYINLVESTAKEAGGDLYKWLLLGVTKSYGYNELHMVYDLPCDRQVYYDRFKKFFWLLDKRR